MIRKLLGPVWLVAMLVVATPADASLTSTYYGYVYCYNISNVASERKTQLKNCVYNKTNQNCVQRANNVDGYKGRAVYIKITSYAWVTGTKWKVYYSYRCDLVREGTSYSTAPRWHPDSII